MFRREGREHRHLKKYAKGLDPNLILRALHKDLMPSKAHTFEMLNPMLKQESYCCFKQIPVGICLGEICLSSLSFLRNVIN